MIVAISLTHMTHFKFTEQILIILPFSDPIFITVYRFPNDFAAFENAILDNDFLQRFYALVIFSLF